MVLMLSQAVQFVQFVLLVTTVLLRKQLHVPQTNTVLVAKRHASLALLAFPAQVPLVR